MLEPYDGKLSRTVLRGEEGRKPLALPGGANYDIQTPKKINNDNSSCLGRRCRHIYLAFF